ncbi:MAG TPA: hypothetical protein VKK79_17670 [Candidatus Lokiarchaeia archaeon]|nr:hypothetical protein [Candidatus Lokiarchaeia archaeon]
MVPFTFDIFNHWDIYLGLSALVALALGTVLYEWNHQLTKSHAILVVLAFILTTINICLIIPQTIGIWGSWTSIASVDWVHLIHIVVGAVGYGAGIIAFITGLSGNRTKLPGYITLICWGFCFIYGIVVWGVNL